MKKVIRLTESDLVKLIKKVVKEQQIQNNQPIDISKIKPEYSLVDDAFSEIRSAMKGMGTDENKIMQALYSLSPSMEDDSDNWDQIVAQKRANYPYLLSLIKKEGNYRSLYEWLSTDLSPKYSESGNAISKGLNKPWKIDTEILKYASKLQDFFKGRKDTID